MKQKSLLKVFFLLCALIVGSGSAWAEDVEKSETFNFSTSGCSGWTTDNAGSYCGGYGRNKNGAYYVANSSISNFSSVNFSSVTNPSVTIYVKALTNGGDNEYTVSLINSSGTVVGTPVKKTGGMGSGSNSSSASESSVVLTPVAGASGYRIDFPAKSAITQTRYTLTYTTGGGGPSTVLNPSFKFGTGTYTTAKSEELSCATDGATIHYTMTEDGTTPDDPTESDATYSSAISVTKSGTIIKAKAFKSDMTASSVVTATYTIKPNKPTITGGANVMITGDAGCTFYYTTATGSDEPTNPTDESTEYTAPFKPDDGTKIKAVAYDAYGNKSDASSVFTFKYMPLAPKNINSNYFVKVTDASTLENGDAILIVNEGENKALGPQSGNNCPEKSVDISNGVISDKGEALKLILVKKTEKVNDDDTEFFYFYTGTAGYLYAAGASSNNYLKTELVPDNNNNARATISISNGDAAITFKGSSTRNIVRYNSSNYLFSCYSSGQNPVQIYKEVVRPVTVTSAEYGTLYYENVALEVPTGAEAYTVKVADKKLVRSKTYNAGDVIAAGTAVVVKATANSYAFTASDVEGVGDANNLLKGSDVAAITTGPDGCKFYKLSLDASNTEGTVGFYWGAADGAAFTSGAHKAYLVIPSGVTLSGKESFLFSDIESDSEGLSEETTGIRSIEQTTEDVVRYNLAGQKVGKDYKGILVINGKKVIRK